MTKIFWSDEAYIHLNGDFSRYHCRIWSESNPHKFITKPLYSLKVSVLVGFTADFCVEPFFFDENVSLESYLEMLQHHLLPQLDHKRKLSSVMFMQDGAPAHFSVKVRQVLMIKVSIFA